MIRDGSDRLFALEVQVVLDMLATLATPATFMINDSRKGSLLPGNGLKIGILYRLSFL